MINWLINVLTPIFTNMGVSETDVEQYVNALSGYIYGILGLIIVMIVVMIGAHWFAKRGTRHVVRWSAAVAWVVCVVVIANVICYGPIWLWTQLYNF